MALLIRVFNSFARTEASANCASETHDEPVLSIIFLKAFDSLLTTFCSGKYRGIAIRSALVMYRLHTPLVREELSIAGIGEDDTVYDAGGLDRRVRVYRLPDDNPHRQVDVTMTVPLAGAGVHPLYARLTLEDGHRVWSSPIYARVKG